jgi:hypothetical protein
MSDYTREQLLAQRRVAQAHLDQEGRLLGTLESRVPEDVRENHRRTITMRAAGWTQRIENINKALEAKGGAG